MGYTLYRIYRHGLDREPYTTYDKGEADRSREKGAMVVEIDDDEPHPVQFTVGQVELLKSILYFAGEWHDEACAELEAVIAKAEKPNA